MYRLVFAVMSESSGLIYANDGLAFHPDPAKRRKGWDTDDQGKPLPADVLDACYRAVRTSLAFEHDDVGNNGGSTGILQQLSQDYVGARFPGSKWGWGTLADTMDIGKACGMFLSRLVITNDTSYTDADGTVSGLNPIAVDVLRVQQPRTDEVRKGGYSAAKVAEYKDIIDNWSPTYFLPGGYGRSKYGTNYGG